MLLLAHVKLAKLLQPVCEELSGDFGLLKFFLGYEKIEFFFAVFQLGQFGLEGLGCKAIHDDIDNVINGGFGFPKLLFKQRQVGRFFVLEAHEAGNNGFNGRIVHQHGPGLVNDEIFNPVLFDGFLLAVIQPLFDCVAFVIAVNGSIAALTTLTVHGCTTMTTEQLGSEQIGFICFGSGWGLAVLGKPLLDTVKKVLGYQRGDAIRDNDVTERVFTNIPTIGQHTLDGSIVDGLSLGIGDTLGIEVVPNLGDGSTLVIHLESFQNERSRFGVGLKVLLTVHDVAQREGASVPFAFLCVDGQAPNNLFFEVF